MLVSLVALAAIAPDRAWVAEARAPRALGHDTYLWQRSWTGAVRASVAAAPRELRGLRVLMVELGAGDAVWPAVDTATLRDAARPVTAVVRIDGARLPAALSIDPVIARVDAWRAAGVDVVGVEIDHDCATAALPDYAVWLARARPAAPLAWSITALPTWADSAALADVAAAVDELIVQVHAVRAPRIFDGAEARRDLARFAAAVPSAALRVALPTYQVEVDGLLRRSPPAEIARFVRWLERGDAPRVRGVVWFRLPVAGDRDAWPAATLSAVIRGERLAPAIAARLIVRGAAFDLELTNRGTVAGPWPALRLRGDVRAADLLGGYVASPSDPRRFTPPARELPAGATIVVGWATGKAISIDAL